MLDCDFGDDSFWWILEENAENPLKSRRYYENQLIIMETIAGIITIVATLVLLFVWGHRRIPFVGEVYDFGYGTRILVTIICIGLYLLALFLIGEL